VVRNADGQALRLAKGSFVFTGAELQPLVAQPLPDAQFLPRSTLKFWGQSLAYSPDGSLLAIGVRNRIVVCRPQTGETLFELQGPGHGVPRLAFDATSRQLTSGNRDGEFMIWDILGRCLQRQVPLGPGCRTFSISPDARWLATAEGSAPRE